MRTFCSGEPGAENYVDLCLKVWRTGELPEVVEPDWFEIFGIAQRGAPEKASQEERFVRFKLFCGVVAARFSELRARSNITSHLNEPIHPAWLRCSSV